MPHDSFLWFSFRESSRGEKKFGEAARMSASSGYFLGLEDDGGRRSADAALPGQEGSGVRLQKGSDNQLLSSRRFGRPVN